MSSRPVSKLDPMSATQTPEPSLGSSAEFSSSLGRALFQQRIEAALLATKASTGADGVAVSLRDGNVYVCRASVGCAPEIGVTVEPGHGICGRCIASAEAVVEQELESEIKSVAAVPVMKDGGVFGFVAGFSLEANAFPQSAVDGFFELAESIHREIDPPIEIKLKPESEGEEADLLAQLGIDPQDGTHSERPEVQEDDSFLSDLVREVLEEAPPQDAPPPKVTSIEIPPATLPQQFTHRTTDDVLMEIVPPLQVPRPKPAVSAPVEPKSNGQGAAAKPALYPETITDVPEKKSSRPTATVPAPAAPIIDTEVLAESPAGWSMARMAVIAVVVLLLVGTVAYFAYFRRSAQSKPQQTAISAAAPATKPDLGVQPPQVQPPAGNQAERAPGTESQLKPAKVPKTREETPLIVAGSDLRKTDQAMDEPPPVTSLGGGARIPAPVLPSTSAPVVFGGQRSTGATPAKVLHRVDPNYPQVARSMHLSGEVVLETLVGADGRVKSVRTLSGPDILATAAADAVRRWRYEPAKQNGKNVESTVEVKVNFR
jgi:TonB family protein